MYCCCCCFFCYSNGGSGGGGCYYCRWRITGVKYKRLDKLSLCACVCVCLCTRGLGLEKGLERIFLVGANFEDTIWNVWISKALSFCCCCMCFVFLLLDQSFSLYAITSHTLLGCVYNLKKRRRRNCWILITQKDLLYMENYTNENRTVSVTMNRQRRRFGELKMKLSV